MSSSPSTVRTHPIVATIAYYLSFIILGLTIAANGPSLLKLADHTSTTLGSISLIFVFNPLGYLIGSFFGGRLFDRFPGHKLLAITLLISGVASILIPISSTLS